MGRLAPAGGFGFWHPPVTLVSGIYKGNELPLHRKGMAALAFTVRMSPESR